jgi:hypothetical protein
MVIMEAMDCRKVRVMKLFSGTKKLVSEGKVKKALQKMHDAEKIMTPQEREKIMNVFTSAVIKRGRQDIERYQETLVVAT